MGASHFVFLVFLNDVDQGFCHEFRRDKAFRFQATMLLCMHRRKSRIAEDPIVNFIGRGFFDA